MIGGERIGGFRDTYLGRQVVSRPGGPRAGMGSAGGLGALRAPLEGFGAEPQPKSNLLPFSPKISHQVATISIIFNASESGTPTRSLLRVIDLSDTAV